MEIVVNKNRCSGHARCADAAPDLYELDDLGYLAITETVVPAGMEKQAQDGATACPERAISLHQPRPAPPCRSGEKSR